MHKISNEPIPENRMQQWHELLCATGGRYLATPLYNPRTNEYRVDYTPGDYAKQCKVWNMLNTPIKETTRGSFKMVVKRLYALYKRNF